MGFPVLHTYLGLKIKCLSFSVTPESGIKAKLHPGQVE